MKLSGLGGALIPFLTVKQAASGEGGGEKPARPTRERAGCSRSKEPPKEVSTVLIKKRFQWDRQQKNPTKDMKYIYIGQLSDRGTQRIVSEGLS